MPEEITPEEFGFTIHLARKICDNVYKPEIDKIILDKAKTFRIAGFCMIIVHKFTYILHSMRK